MALRVTADAPGGVHGKIAAPLAPHGALKRHQEGKHIHAVRVPGPRQPVQRIGSGPDRVGIEREYRALPQLRQRVSDGAT